VPGAATIPSRSLVLSAAALALACAGSRGAVKPAAGGDEAPDAAFRSAKPPPSAAELRFSAPVPSEARLPDGARLLVVENHAVPIVSIEVVVPAGVAAEPPDKAGLAGFTASMLTEGTSRLPALAFSAAVEDLAARLSASSGPESTRVRLNCLVETLPQALDLLAAALVEPAFRAEDVERVRGLLLSGLLQKKASPPALAADEASRILFGPKHPLGQPAGGTPATVKGITRDDLARFHATWYRPEGSLVSVSGDTTLADMQRLLGEKLAAWRAQAPPALSLPPRPAIDRRTVTLVDKPGASQSQVWLVAPLFPASHPDRVPLTIANNVLGGLFGSRLMMNLREEKGYSYGVRSSLQLARDYGWFQAAGGVQAKYTAESLAEFEKELLAFSTGELREGELQKSKEAAIRSLPAALETNDAVAGSIAQAVFVGLPPDWYRRLPGLVAAVDAAAVARVARAWLDPARMPAIVVGPRAGNEEKIRALDLGPVEERTPE
jgi:zinc protease